MSEQDSSNCTLEEIAYDPFFKCVEKAKKSLKRKARDDIDLCGLPDQAFIQNPIFNKQQLLETFIHESNNIQGLVAKRGSDRIAASMHNNKVQFCATCPVYQNPQNNVLGFLTLSTGSHGSRDQSSKANDGNTYPGQQLLLPEATPTLQELSIVAKAPPSFHGVHMETRTEPEINEMRDLTKRNMDFEIQRRYSGIVSNMDDDIESIMREPIARGSSALDYRI